jgi:large subunit ribosomal protein L10
VKIDQKKKIVQELHDKFSRSKIVIVTDYKGLNVTTIDDLRRRLRDAGIEYRVAKNSLLVRASDKTDIAAIKAYFVGPTAVALGYDDPVAPAKLLTEFAKEHANLEIKGGVLNGKALDPNAVKSLAALPSREVILGQFLSVLVGVPTSMVRALNNVPQRLLNVMLAVKEQKEAA